MPVLTALALGMFVLFMRFLPELASWPEIPLCGPDDCNLQGWLGALSGWFGGFAGFGAIAYIALQLREQKRQTDFIVGDGLPTMDAIEHLKNGHELVVRIVNWNRCAVVVRGISALNRDYFVVASSVKTDGKEIASFTVGCPTFHISGWEDRSKAPHIAEIRLEAWSDSDLSTAKDWSNIPTVVARVQIVGEQHRVLDLRADTGLAQAAQ